MVKVLGGVSFGSVVECMQVAWSGSVNDVFWFRKLQSCGGLQGHLVHPSPDYRRKPRFGDGEGGGHTGRVLDPNPVHILFFIIESQHQKESEQEGALETNQSNIL